MRALSFAGILALACGGSSGPEIPSPTGPSVACAAGVPVTAVPSGAAGAPQAAPAVVLAPTGGAPIVEPILPAAGAAGCCGVSREDPVPIGSAGMAGTPGTGGVGTGGLAATGGAATGGMATGGMATGGMATGGMATGGQLATGGSATGGVATGGAATGGMATTGGAPPAEVVETAVFEAECRLVAPRVAYYTPGIPIGLLTIDFAEFVFSEGSLWDCGADFSVDAVWTGNQLIGNCCGPGSVRFEVTLVNAVWDS